MIANRFTIDSKLGQGGFSSVYQGTDSTINCKVAIKFTKKSLKSFYAVESLVMAELSGSKHFPKLIWKGEHQGELAIIMELLGKSLTAKIKTRRFSYLTICRIGIQIVKALKTFHDLGYIHRDIKPDNIVCGLNRRKLYYLIDFGLAKSFMDKSTKHHYPQRPDLVFKGNLMFCSNNVLSGIQASRRDDIISVMYILIYLIKQDLPWIDSIRSVEAMIGVRSSCTDASLLKDLPSSIVELFNYSQCLGFYQRPNYEFIISLLIKSKKSCRIEFSENILVKKSGLEKKIHRESVMRSKSDNNERASKDQSNSTIRILAPDFNVEMREHIKFLRKGLR